METLQRFPFLFYYYFRQVYILFMQNLQSLSKLLTSEAKSASINFDKLFADIFL